MVRIRCTPEIVQVTTHARRRRQVVVAIRVTLCTLNADVRSGQRKAALRVVEVRRLPG